MKALLTYSFIVCALVVFFLLGCEKRFDLSVLPDPGEIVTIGDTSYVEIFPPWGGFENPRAVMVGNDHLIYVADYDRNKVFMLDASGAFLDTLNVLHPISLTQNSKLDLYIGGETIAPNGIDTIGSIYKVYLVRFDTTYVARIDTIIGPFGDTTIVPIVRDTSFFADHNFDLAPVRIVRQEPAHPKRRFPGIGILPGNDYLVSRTGPDNSSFVDPDTRVLLFHRSDALPPRPLADLATRPSGGTFITDINQLTGIMVFPSSSDFVLTQSSEGVAYGAIWMIYQKTPDFDGWIPKYDPSKPEQRIVDFIRPYRFLNATAAAYDRRRRELFIVDAQLDSVVKFNRNGQFRKESFGKYKTASNEFPGLDNPQGVAFSNDCTLYIADTGNKVIRRFKLSIQTSCF